MISRKELFKRPEYWMERIQNDVFRALNEYKESKKMNQTELAKELGFSKGYISQVLNGNFNFSLSKLIDLSLAIGVAPDVQLKDIEDFIAVEERRLDHLKNHGFAKIERIAPTAPIEVNADQIRIDQYA